jgi:alpha-glucosidase
MRAAEKPGASWLHFLNTHDTPSFLHQVGDPRKMRLATTLMLTVWGVPVIFSGDEVGRLATEWPDNRPDFPASGVWDRRTLEHHKRFIELRRRHPALSRGAHRTLHAEGDLLVFLRWWKDPSGAVADAVIVALNRSESAPARVDLPIPPELSAAPPMLGLSAEDDHIRFDVPPLDGLVIPSVR